MNIDTGKIVLWKDLSDAERESGRWVKMSDDELAVALTVEQHQRRTMLQDIFGPPPSEQDANARLTSRRHV